MCFMNVNQSDHRRSISMTITMATHYDITKGNNVAMDVHCDITMGNDVARDINCDVIRT